MARVAGDDQRYAPARVRPLRHGLRTGSLARIKDLGHAVRELCKTNEILNVASAHVAQAEFDRQLRK